MRSRVKRFDKDSIWSIRLQLSLIWLHLFVWRFFCPLEGSHHLVTRLWTKKELFPVLEDVETRKRFISESLQFGSQFMFNWSTNTCGECKLAVPGTTFLVWLFTGKNEENRAVKTGWHTLLRVRTFTGIWIRRSRFDMHNTSPKSWQWAWIYQYIRKCISTVIHDIIM